MLISAAMPPWTACFNAGDWAVRNSQRGRTLMNNWLSLFEPKKWRKLGSSWATVDAADEYAGESYEQGSFIAHIMPEYKKDIRVVGYETINNPFYSERGNAIHHSGMSVVQRRLVYETARAPYMPASRWLWRDLPPSGPEPTFTQCAANVGFGA